MVTLRSLFSNTMFWLVSCLFWMPALTSAPFVYVGNFNGSDYYVIDSAVDIVPAPNSIAANPIRGIAISPDGTKAYFSSYNSGEIFVVDTASQAVLQIIPGLSFPRGIAITPDGTMAYVASQDNKIFKVNLLTLAVVSIPTSGGSFFAAISPDGQYVYVPDSSGVVNVIRISDGQQTSVTVGSLPCGVAFTPDGTKVFVVNSGFSTVSIIDVATQIVTTTLSISSPGSQSFDIAISPDGKKAYVTCVGSSKVAVIDVDKQTVESTEITVESPLWIAITPDGTKAYVSGPLTDNVFVINLADNSVVTLTGITQAYALAITPVILPPSPPISPRKCRGKVKRNLFLSLKWKKSRSDDVVRYDIFARKRWLASVPATARRTFVKKLHSPYLVNSPLAKKYLRFLRKKYNVRAVASSGLMSHRKHPKVTQ
jgi:YVTN family beta-propeller protein